jgi:glutamate formiminotransferase/formiminotetrahydrofolate cyclodeaminase
MKLVECVPNFSEGRRKEVVDEIIKSITSVPGVQLLDMEMDPDHNRSVITFVAPPEEALEAAYRGIEKATELIDLNVHRGEHPRIGATDVVPFVPLKGVTMEECVSLAERLGERVAENLKIPVYLYEEAARRPERRDLAVIRKGEFEGLREAIKTDPEREPDFGPKELHPTAGAVVIGARKFLIAYNVNLGTTDLKIAKAIAKRVRARGGGLAFVKALGFDLRERGMVQVSMNLVDYEKSPVYAAYELVKLYADHYGVPVVESEIVGLVPEQALFDIASFYLKLRNFKPDQTIEARLREKNPVENFLVALSSDSPAPGGGSASALALAQGYALLSMVAKLTLKKKKYEEYHPVVRPIEREASGGVKEALTLMEKDEEAFNRVIEAMRMKRETEEEKRARRKAIEEALKEASRIPMQILNKAMEGLPLAKRLAEYGLKSAISDVGCAIEQFNAAFRGAYLNVKINLSGIEDREYRDNMAGILKENSDKFEREIKEIRRIIDEKMG